MESDRKYVSAYSQDQSGIAPENETLKSQLNEDSKSQKTKKRLLSLDVFRGLTMTGMILVDDQGSLISNGREAVIWPCNHSQWDGWTTADQVFPNFQFIMGMAIPFSMKQDQRKDVKVWFRILKRGFLLFLIGAIINYLNYIPQIATYHGSYEFTLRIPGILQRTGISYIFVSSIYLLVKDIRIQLAIYVSLMAIYLGFQYGFDVPGCGKGVLTPSCNFGGYLDRLMFGSQEFIPGAAISRWAWLPSDPEGFWGYLTGFFNTFMGMVFCLIMQNLKSDSKKLTNTWLFLSLGLCFLGLFMNLQGMPLNKKMWSVSFMFFTSGFSGLSLVGLYYLIDVIDKPIIKKIFSPFVWLGMNPLFIYVLMMVEQAIVQSNIQTKKMFEEGDSPWRQFTHYVFQSWLINPYVANMANALFYWSIWTLVAYLLQKKQIFIKL